MAWLDCLVASVDSEGTKNWQRMKTESEITSRMKEEEAEEAEDARPQGRDGRGLTHLCLSSSGVVKAQHF